MTTYQDGAVGAAGGSGVTSGAPGAAEAPPPVPRLWLVVPVIALGALATSLSMTMLVPIVTSLPRMLGTDATSASWLMTSNLLAACVATPLAGRLGDMYGRRLALLGVIGCLLAGSVLCAVTESIPLLITGRALQGVSVAAVPLGISLVGAVTRPGGSAIGLVSGMMGVGGAFGMPLAGWAADRWSLAVLFWGCAAVALLCLVTVALFVPESPVRNPGRVDLVGAALMTAMLLALLVPVSQGNRWGWTSARTLAPLAACAVLAWVFGRYELGRRDPVVDLRELRRRPVLLTNVCSMLASAAFFSTSVGTAAYVQAPVATGYGFGASVLTGGLCLLPMGAMMMLLSPASGRINGRFGPRATMIAAMCAVVAGLAARMVWTGRLWQVVAGTTVVGVGTGLAFMAMPALIMRHTPPEGTAAANGVNSLARSVGSAISSAATTALLAAVTAPVPGSPAEMPTLTAYQYLFAMCAGFAAVAAVLMLGVPGRDAPGARRAWPAGG